MTIFAFQKDFVQELKKLFTEFRIDVKKELKKVNIFYCPGGLRVKNKVDFEAHLNKGS